MMKNIFFNVLIISFLSSCIYIKRDNEEVLKQQRECARLDSLYLLYDSMPPRFDIKAFNENRNAHFYYNIYEDSILTKYRQIRNDYVKEIAYQNSVLVERSLYDSTGLIRNRFHSLSSSFDIPYGKRFEYDENGKLINVIERYSAFNFTFDDLVAALDSMELYKEYIIYSIYDGSRNNKYYWEITILTTEFEGETIYFDSETGELFEEIP